MNNEKFLLRNISYCILFLLCLIWIVSCGNNSFYKPEIYTPVNLIKNSPNHYCFVNGKNYIDFCVLSDDGKLDYISETIPPNEYQVDTVVRGMTAEDEMLYYYTRDYRIAEDGQIIKKTIIYKFDAINNEIYKLDDWDTLKSEHNNSSIQIYENYLYFFKSNEYGSNDICRINKNGGEFEKLTDNHDSIYTGLFFFDDSVYYQKDLMLYKTTMDNLKNGELLFENISTIELYNGYFYCKDSKSGSFYRIDPKDSESVETLITDMYGSYYIIKDDIIYYSVYDPTEIGINKYSNITIYNETQGKIYAYNISTGEKKLFFQDKNMMFRTLLNINDDSILVKAYTNEQAVNSENGVPQEYYIVPLDGTKPYLIEDLT